MEGTKIHQHEGGDKDRDAVFNLMTAGWVSQTVYVGTKLGLPDLVNKGITDVKTLSERTDANPDALYRLMRAMASVGLFSQDESGNFSLTSMGKYLLSDKEDTMRDMVLMHHLPIFQRSWAHLPYSVKTGKPAFEDLYGKHIFEHLATDHESSTIFNRAMTNKAVGDVKAIMDAYDFSGIKTVMDLAGGEGHLLVSILKAHPSMKGILVDLPHVAESAKKKCDVEGLSDRCKVVEGSFFETPPSDLKVDACMVNSTLHNWNDEKAKEILKYCHAVLEDKGRLLLLEFVVPPGNELHFSKWLDMTMLVLLGGKERTCEEHEELLESTGFKLHRVIPTKTSLSIIEATKAGTDKKAAA